MDAQANFVHDGTMLNQGSSEASLLLVAVIWGSGFVATQGALDAGVPPNLIIAMRFIIASILCYGLYFRRLRELKSVLFPGFVLGFFLAMGFIFQTIGQHHTTPSKSAFLTAMNILFTPFIYFFLTRKHIKRRILFSVALGIVGIGFLTLDKLSGLNYGDMLVLICAVAFAFHIYFIGYYVRDKNCDVIKLVFLQFLFAAIISSMAVLFFKEFTVPSAKGLGYVAYMSVFTTMIAFLLQNSAQRFVKQSKAALLLSSEAVFGTLLSILILKETLTPFMIVGFILFICSIVIAETGNN